MSPNRQNRALARSQGQQRARLRDCIQASCEPQSSRGLAVKDYSSVVDAVMSRRRVRENSRELEELGRMRF